MAEYSSTGPAQLNKEQAGMVNPGFLIAFPNMKLAVERVFMDGDYVAMHWTASGAYTGPLMTENGEIPPTGRQGVIKGVYTAEIKDNRIAREWTHWDQVALLAQLGLMP